MFAHLGPNSLTRKWSYLHKLCADSMKQCTFPSYFLLFYLPVAVCYPNVKLYQKKKNKWIYFPALVFLLPVWKKKWNKWICRFYLKFSDFFMEIFIAFDLACWYVSHNWSLPNYYCMCCRENWKMFFRSIHNCFYSVFNWNISTGPRALSTKYTLSTLIQAICLVHFAEIFYTVIFYFWNADVVQFYMPSFSEV